MDVFLRLGYPAATMELIAAEAGVSKQTVYNHFQSKEGLFKSIVEDMTSTLMAPLVLRDARRSTPEKVLNELGRDLLTMMLQPSSLSLYRLIVAESVRFPELGGDIYAVGTGRLLGSLADYLAWEGENGRLDIPDAAMAAEQFVGLLSGRAQLRALLGVQTDLDRETPAQRAAFAVSCFLSIYRPVGGQVQQSA